jgi:hypothetical protein
MADKTYLTALYEKDGGNTHVVAAGGLLVNDAGQPGYETTWRGRVTLAQLNAGFTLLPALPGYMYRLTDATMIAVGGNAAVATSVDISGTQAAAGVKLLSVAIAALTRSAVNKPHTANATVLADGASFVANDVNTPLTIGVTGSALTTLTAIDVILTVAVEQ